MELNSFVLHLFGFICRIRSSRFFSFFSCVLFRPFSVLCVRVCVSFSLIHLVFFFTWSFRWRTKGPRCRCEGERIVSCVCRVSFWSHLFSSVVLRFPSRRWKQNYPTKNQQKQKTHNMHHQVQPNKNKRRTTCITKREKSNLKCHMVTLSSVQTLSLISLVLTRCPCLQKKKKNKVNLL